MSPLDDHDVTSLLRRAYAGDDEAWRALVMRYGEILRRVADFNLDSRVRPRFDPDDVVQETLIDAFKMLGEFFDTPVPFSIWLRQRLVDRVGRIHRDHLKTCKRDAGRDSAAEACRGREPMDSGTSPSGRAMREEAGRLLHAALGQLTEGDREIIFLFFIDMREHREIESILGLNPAAARQRLHRAVVRVGGLLRSSHPEWCHEVETRRRCTECR